MSEYLIQGETLTALADEIRVLSGSEGAMGLDAMKSNVNTANSAVSAALSALVDKGVEVPDGSNVSGLAELIGALEVGGVKVVSGTVTFSSTQFSYEFLSDPPDIFIVYKEDENNNIHTDANTIWAVIQFPIEDAQYGYYQYTFGYNNGTKKYYVPYYTKKTSTAYTGKVLNSTFNGTLGAAITYRYFGIYGVTR